MPRTLRAKVRSVLDFRIFETSSTPKARYLVLRLPDGSYHTFVEVEAKEAAIKCGAIGGRGANTRRLWDQLWK